MMGIFLLLIVLAAISFAFARAAISLLRYRKQLQDTQGGFGVAFSENHPRWYVRMKFVLPVTIAGFCFSAMSAALAFVYVVVRFANDHL